MEHYKTIEQARKVLRPSDKLVKILSNKYMIAKSSLVGGGFADETVFGLDQNIIYAYGDPVSLKRLDVEAISSIKRNVWCFYRKSHGEVLYNTEAWRVKTQDNRGYKRRLRKIKSLLN
jgi:hypothetical protein